MKIEPEAKTPTGEIVSRREAYLRSSQWGKYGWSFLVRMKPFVIELAETLFGISKGYGSVVREAVIRFNGNPVPTPRKAKGEPV